MKRTTLAILAAATLFLSGCDETDAVAVRVRVENDLTGSLTTSALELPAATGAVGQSAAGVQWSSRVAVVCNAGTFGALSDVKLGDLAFAGGTNPSGLCFASLTVPRGPAAAWAKTLVPLSSEDRSHAARALDPTGKQSQVGATIKFEFTLPANVIGNGLQGKTRGVKVSSDGNVATLVVPLDTALSAGEPFVWHLTWQK
jgi:hypothetical protein